MVTVQFVYQHYQIYFLIACAFVCGFFTSCNDRPGVVGSEILPATSIQLLQLNSDSLPLISTIRSDTVHKVLNLDGWFVGKAGTTEAKTFINFNVPFIPLAVLFPDVTSNDITAHLVLPTTTFLFGDTVRNNHNFKVTEVQKDWSSIATTATLGDLNALEQTGLVYGRTVGSFVGKLAVDLTLKETVRVRLDPRLILSWLQTDTSITKINGLAILANKSSSVIRFIEPNSSYIEVKIRRKSDTLDTYYSFSERSFATFVTDERPTNPTSIVVQPGVLYRSLVTLDLSVIPMLSFVHNAKLTLTWNPDASRLSNRGMLDTLYLKFPTTDSSIPLISADGVPAVPGIRVEGTNQYVFGRTTDIKFNSLSSIIERLVESTTGSVTSRTMVLQATRDTEVRYFNVTPDYHETTDLSRMVFYGVNDPDPTKRPKLEITYSPRKK